MKLSLKKQHLKIFQRLRLPKPPNPKPLIRLLPPKRDLFLDTIRLLFVTPGLFCRERLLPNPVAPAFRFAVRNFVLLILLRDFFEVERNLLEDTLLPPAVFEAE